MKFEESSFRASLTKFEYSPQGEGLIRLTVPYKDRHACQPLVDAFGLEVEVTITRKGAG